MHGIPRAPGHRAYLAVGREVGALCAERLAVFVPSLPHPLLSTVCQCDGWVVRFCQPSVRSPSWSWLPIVVAPGCLRHPTSTVSVRVTKLFTCINFCSIHCRYEKRKTNQEKKKKKKKTQHRQNRGCRS